MQRCEEVNQNPICVRGWLGADGGGGWRVREGWGGWVGGG